MKFAAAAALFLLHARSASAAGGDGYTYFEEGGLGPSGWATLQINSNQCGGMKGLTTYGQSPVTISQGVGLTCDSTMFQYRFNDPIPATCTWDDLDFSIGSNGVKVQPKKNAGCSFGSMKVPQSRNAFSALQFHIHTSSEHQILGQGEDGFFDAELHVVHAEEAEVGGSFAVFGTMISVGDTAHEMFEWFLQGFEAAQQKVEDECEAATDVLVDGEPKQKLVTCPAIGQGTWFDFSVADKPAWPADEVPVVYDLPTNEDFGVYTYKGGLTTPPCTEIVNWNLLDTPMEISAGQMDRLKNLILCYVVQNKNALGAITSCGHGTVADEFGSTSRPPQPLEGRTVLHRCRDEGRNFDVPDIGVQPEDVPVFVRPERKAEPSNTEEGKCSKNFYEDCSDDKRYNPEVSPNLKANEEIWYDAEGYWIGTMTSYGPDGEILQPVFDNDNIENTIPYPRKGVQLFLNRTVKETRYYEHIHKVYEPAPDSFCSLSPPEGSSNSLGNGVCGVNGFVTYSERFGTATFEKDGVVSMYLANGPTRDAETSTIDIINEGSIFYSASKAGTDEEDGFLISETQSFTNKEKTQLSGTGQFMIFSSRPPFDENPLAETFTYVFNRVSEEDFKSSLFTTYNVEKVDTKDRIFFPNDEGCIGWYDGICPTEEMARKTDPKYADTPYEEDPQVKAGFIALFAILALGILFSSFFFTMRYRERKQKERYRMQFAQRIADTIDFKGHHEALTPELLEEEFKRVDTDGDGVLSKDEIHSFMGERMDDRDFNAMFAAIDIDHDGVIEFSEFCAFIAMTTKEFDDYEDQLEAQAEEQAPVKAEAPAEPANDKFDIEAKQE